MCEKLNHSCPSAKTWSRGWCSGLSLQEMCRDSCAWCAVYARINTTLFKKAHFGDPELLQFPPASWRSCCHPCPVFPAGKSIAGSIAAPRGGFQGQPCPGGSARRGTGGSGEALPGPREHPHNCRAVAKSVPEFSQCPRGFRLKQNEPSLPGSQDHSYLLCQTCQICETKETTRNDFWGILLITHLLSRKGRGKGNQFLLNDSSFSPWTRGSLLPLLLTGIQLPSTWLFLPAFSERLNSSLYMVFSSFPHKTRFVFQLSNFSDISSSISQENNSSFAAFCQCCRSALALVFKHSGENRDARNSAKGKWTKAALPTCASIIP